MKSFFENLFAYESWANKEIADSLTAIESPPEKAMSLMSHIIDAQIIWLSRIKNEKSDIAVWQNYEKSVMKDALKKSSDDLKNFVENINEDELDEIIFYKNTKGESFKSSLRDILTHLIIHSSYHRGQIVLEIKPFVKVLPYTDYIHYAREIK